MDSALQIRKGSPVIRQEWYRQLIDYISEKTDEAQEYDELVLIERIMSTIDDSVEAINE